MFICGVSDSFAKIEPAGTAGAAGRVNINIGRARYPRRRDAREKRGRNMAAMTAPTTAPTAAPASWGIPECTRPCYESGGVVHDFCGRTHAAEAVSRKMLDSLRRPHGDCHVRKLTAK